MSNTRRELTKKEKRTFIRLVSELSSQSIYNRQLGLSPNDVEYYKRIYEINNPDEALKLLKKLEYEAEFSLPNSEINKVRSAERAANARLQQLENEKNIKKATKIAEEPADEIRAKNAERQRKFDEKLNQLEKEQTWTLPLFGTKTNREKIIERFKEDIQSCGMNFCIKKYKATSKEIKSEAKVLGLKIDWDLVRR